MSNWYDELEPDERDQFDEYVAHFRQNVLHEIAGASIFTSILPPDSQGDPKFWMELGAAIMFDKPLVVLAMPGQEVPRKLKALADKVIVVDIDTEDGREKAARELAHYAQEFGG